MYLLKHGKLQMKKVIKQQNKHTNNKLTYTLFTMFLSISHVDIHAVGIGDFFSGIKNIASNLVSNIGVTTTQMEPSNELISVNTNVEVEFLEKFEDGFTHVNLLSNPNDSLQPIDFYTENAIERIEKMLLKSNLLPTTYKSETITDTIYMITDVDIMHDTNKNNNISVKFNKISDTKNGQFVIAALDWFRNNKYDNQEVRKFLVAGLHNHYILFTPPHAVKKDLKLRSSYLEALRKIYLPSITNASEDKQEYVSKLQLKFAEMMTECMKNEDIIMCSYNAKLISKWLLNQSRPNKFVNTIFDSEQQANDEMEYEEIEREKNIPEWKSNIQEIIYLRDKIQENTGIVTRSNTKTAGYLSRWIDNNLCETVLNHEFDPQQFELLHITAKNWNNIRN